MDAELDEQALRDYVERFDAGAYWDAHEALEAAWRRSGAAWQQGLIQVAAVFVHIEAGRYRAAAGVLGRARGHLAKDAPVDSGIDLAPLRAYVDVLAGRLSALGEGERLDAGGRPCMARYLTRG
jgi:predicted metal-dependent hydrolase